MNIWLKRVVKILYAAVLLCLVGYGVYHLYEYAVENAARRVKAGVISGIGSAINPLKWPRRLLGF